MDMSPASLSLTDRLRACADIWCAATGRTLGALSTIVTNQGSFFERLGGERPSATTATLEKFARYLGDKASWPDSTVPADVAEFAIVMLGAVGTDALGGAQESRSDHAAEVAQQ